MSAHLADTRPRAVNGAATLAGPLPPAPNGTARHAPGTSPSSAGSTMQSAPPAAKRSAVVTVDAELEQAVRHAGYLRRGFYLVVLLVALAGQVSGAVTALHIPLLWAIPAVGALELGGVVVLANADVRRRLGEHAIGSRILSAAIAAGAVAFNWLAHQDHLLGGFFAGMSALGYLVWLTHAENSRRDRLRALGDLPPTTPAYEVVGHWLRHPWLTRRARSLAKADPDLGLYASLAAARTEIRTERRQAAIATVLHRKIRAAVDPTTADIAVAVFDLDIIADRLADGADYDGLTALIAHDLTPARLTAPTPHRADQHTPATHTTSAPPPAPHTGPTTDSPDRTPARTRAAVTASARVEHTEPASDDDKRPSAAVQAPSATPTTPPAAPTVDHDNHPPTTGRPDTNGSAAAADVPLNDPAVPATTAAVVAASHWTPVPAGPARQPGEERPEPSTGPTRLDGDASPVDGPRPGAEHHTAQDTRKEGHDEQDEDTDTNGADADGEGDEDTVPQETVAAVAYWYHRLPDPHPRDIAARIGRSERTVRRYWPPSDDISQ
ncbi:hypothetical protein AB0M46_24110 [Dactylosporangium sp. NPDC051485]|uniref:hypothetical protein n=1 Tax=Dactylosporangium sp. NPDC051485 TaxID=3154846 RepID=UPI00344008F4